MTIQRGQEWGVTVARPAGLVTAVSDAELATLVGADRGGAYTVTAGDLHRTLGAPVSRDPVQRLSVDALMVSIDGRELLAVAHVVARRRPWLRGPIVAVMNVDHCGVWNVAPRAHPNDGRFDVVEVAASMSLRDRMAARRRLNDGTHVPHPAITTRTATGATWDFAQVMNVIVDGIARGRCRRLTVTILPDHFAVNA